MFKKLAGVAFARDILIENCTPVDQTEEHPIESALGRVLAEDIFSPEDLPAFNRAAMDGYALRSCETRGATPNAPSYIADYMKIRTGAAVPDCFDAVVMLEDAATRGSLLEVTAELTPYRNISRIGEDLKAGDLVVSKGHRLRPPDLALLAAVGVARVRIFSQPRIAVIPTGSELVSKESVPKPGEAREINGLMICSYVKLWGGRPFLTEIVPDDRDALRHAIEKHIDSDLVILSGGTSVGERDYAPIVLEEIGELMVHGVRLTPGRPTAIGAVGDTPVICLPGYPVAALASLYLFVRPAVKKLARLSDAIPKTNAVLSRKIPSRPGYITFARVSLKNGAAEPVMISGAGVLSSVAKADGFVLVPEEREGLNAGEEVAVHIFE